MPSPQARAAAKEIRSNMLADFSCEESFDAIIDRHFAPVLAAAAMMRHNAQQALDAPSDNPVFALVVQCEALKGRVERLEARVAAIRVTVERLKGEQP